MTSPAAKYTRLVFKSIYCTVIDVVLSVTMLTKVIQAAWLLARKSSLRDDLARKSVSRINYSGSWGLAFYAQFLCCTILKSSVHFSASIFAHLAMNYLNAVFSEFGHKQ
jgi:hypothetical protein